MLSNLMHHCEFYFQYDIMNLKLVVTAHFTDRFCLTTVKLKSVELLLVVNYHVDDNNNNYYYNWFVPYVRAALHS